MKHFYTLFLILLAFAVSCGKEPVIEPDDAPDVEVPGEVVSGLSDIKNQYADKEVSYMGATVSVKFAASASWTASLVPSGAILPHVAKLAAYGSISMFSMT